MLRSLSLSLGENKSGIKVALGFTLGENKRIKMSLCGTDLFGKGRTSKRKLHNYSFITN